MKKFGVMLMTAVLLVALCATALAAEIYYVKTPGGGHLNVRSWRDTDSEVIGKLAYGAQVSVQEIYGGWAKIYWGSYGDGYVYAQYLSRTKPSAKPSGSSSSSSSSSSGSSSTGSGSFNPATAYQKMEPVSYDAQVTPATVSGNINLRWGPSTNTPIMSVRRSGATLHVIAEDSTWCQVYDETTGECGYMMKKFLLEVTGVSGIEG